MRSYALTDLERLSDLSRRTISDYISKGLLHGPSHRGRGARYSQRDLDALLVIPRIRTLLKQEFPHLSAVRSFLDRLSPYELHQLARLTSEMAFEVEVRRLRVLNRLKNFSPSVAPERIRDALRALTPEQIRGVDRGHFQVGSMVDLDWIAGEPKPSARGYRYPYDEHDAAGGRPDHDRDRQQVEEPAEFGAARSGLEAGAAGTEYAHAGPAVADRDYAERALLALNEASREPAQNRSSRGAGAYRSGGENNGHGRHGRPANGDDFDAGRAGDDSWASFGNATVEIRIEKQALMNRDAHGRIAEAIRQFSTRLEEVLKAYS